MAHYQSKTKNINLLADVLPVVAERGGFEPPVPRKQDNGFRDRRIRPLCHLSLNFSRICHGVYPAQAGPPLLKF
jgi:hypothetical protein